jgi:NADH:ubiquinone oxidoreductase subunit 4 (subunit M)
MLRAYRSIFQGPEVQATREAADLTATERPPAIFLAFVLLAVGFFPNLLLGLIDKPEDETVLDLQAITTSIEPAPGATGLYSRQSATGN